MYINDLLNAKQLLSQGAYTCVFCKEENIYTSKFRGVKPLVAWYNGKTDFSGFSAADKVIGKATAFLYRLLKVKAVYASVISESALEVLKEAGIEAEYEKKVNHIINRTGDGVCPFELVVLDIQDEKEAYEAIRKKMEELNIEI